MLARGKCMRSFLDGFAAQVRTRPDAVAAAADGVEATYAELNRATDAIARDLWNGRRSDNDVIGFLGNVGIERIVAYTGALKAGCAFINLDPALPLAALGDIIENSRLARIVATPEFSDVAVELLGAAPISIRLEHLLAANAPKFEPPPHDPEALATIRYTSGSTGRPKGVPMSYGQWDRRAPDLGMAPDDRYGVFNQFWLGELRALSSGTRLECFDFRKYGPQRLASWLQEHEITWLDIFSAMFRALMKANSGAYPTIRVVDLTGELLLRADLENFNAYFPPGAQLKNCFSATECGAVAEFIHRQGEPVTFDTAPIGKIIARGDVRLLTEAGEDATDGEPGEMVIVADYLPTGYYNDPERSATVFEPVEDGTGRRLYRTGFMVYRDYRGDLHPIGRKDEEIKIRGYNVRPSEVEQMLAEHPGVEIAAVAPFVGPHGIRRLACHYVPATDPAPSSLDLRLFLRERAANYMVPSVFLPQTELPRTDNGKIRRQALPNPMDLMAGVDDRPRDALTVTEETVARGWREVLGHGDFSLTDDFFDVGGDSLQAMTMLMEIEKSLGVRTPFESLILNGATVRTLAERIDALAGGAADAASVEELPVVLKQGGDRAAIYALPVLGGHLSDYLQLLHCLDGRQPVLGVHPRGMDGRSAPDGTMAALAAHAARTIRRQDSIGPYTLMGYSYGSVVAFETARRLIELGGEVADLILLDPIAPWKDGLRDLRAIYRPLKQGDALAAARRALETVGATLGQGRSPTSIDDAHRRAMRRYRPKPLALPRVLVVSAEGNPTARAARQEWRRLIGAGMEAVGHPGEHFTMVRAPQVWALGQKLGAWLAAAPARPMGEPAPIVLIGMEAARFDAVLADSAGGGIIRN